MASRVSSADDPPWRFQEIKWPRPDTGARPRRIAITSDDIGWYTDFARGYLGRLDPKTGGVREWPSPGGERSLRLGRKPTMGRPVQLSLSPHQRCLMNVPSCSSLIACFNSPG